MPYKQPPKEHQFKPGKEWRGNKKGRPEGVSVVANLKRIFREDPEKFDEFLERYRKNPGNEKHIAEMIDGSPRKGMDLEVNFPTSLIEAIKYGITNETRDERVSEEDTE